MTEIVKLVKTKFQKERLENEVFNLCQLDLLGLDMSLLLVFVSDYCSELEYVSRYACFINRHSRFFNLIPLGRYGSQTL
jgi:hypothetical protein